MRGPDLSYARGFLLFAALGAAAFHAETAFAHVVEGPLVLPPGQDPLGLPDRVY